jgi:hypothetical protein
MDGDLIGNDWRSGIPVEGQGLAGAERIVNGLIHSCFCMKVEVSIFVINEVFPTRKEQNPYAGSLIGLGNYPSLVHLTYAVAEKRGLSASGKS